MESSCDQSGVELEGPTAGSVPHSVPSGVGVARSPPGVRRRRAGDGGPRPHPPRAPAARRDLGGPGVEWREIDAVALAGPGLASALLVGADGACARWRRRRQADAAPWTTSKGTSLAYLSRPIRPTILGRLVASGGTERNVEGVGRSEILGGTIDDAAGEAFDKSVKSSGSAIRVARRWHELGEDGNPEAIARAARISPARRPELFVHEAEERRWVTGNEETRPQAPTDPQRGRPRRQHPSGDLRGALRIAARAAPRSGWAGWWWPGGRRGVAAAGATERRGGQARPLRALPGAGSVHRQRRDASRSAEGGCACSSDPSRASFDYAFDVKPRWPLDAGLTAPPERDRRESRQAEQQRQVGTGFRHGDSEPEAVVGP